MKQKTLLSTLTVCAFAVLALPSQASAQTVPFQITGNGMIDQLPFAGPEFWSASGTATQQGSYQAAGSVQIDGFVNANTVLFSSATPAVFTAANGDQICFDFAGILTVDASGSVWDAEFVPIEGCGTGRFENVSGGSYTMIATTGPLMPGVPVEFDWNGLGHLVFDH